MGLENTTIFKKEKKSFHQSPHVKPVVMEQVGEKRPDESLGKK